MIAMHAELTKVKDCALTPAMLLCYEEGPAIR